MSPVRTTVSGGAFDWILLGNRKLGLVLSRNRAASNRWCTASCDTFLTTLKIVNTPSAAGRNSRARRSGSRKVQSVKNETGELLQILSERAWRKTPTFPPNCAHSSFPNREWNSRLLPLIKGPSRSLPTAGRSRSLATNRAVPASPEAILHTARDLCTHSRVAPPTAIRLCASEHTSRGSPARVFAPRGPDRTERCT